MRNVEFKSRLLDPERAERICRAIGAVRVGVIEQTDTYYEFPEGRLKRRECPDRPAEWIHYFRDDQRGAKLSEYALYTDDEAAARFDPEALRVWVVVDKRRILWMKERVRIHLDEVQGLGSFLEIEAIVDEKQDEAQARAALSEVRAPLESVLGEPFAGSYSDLLAPMVG